MDKGQLFIPLSPTGYLEEFLSCRNDVVAIRKQRAFYKHCEESVEKKEIIAELRRLEKHLMRKEKEARALIEKVPRLDHRRVLLWKYVNGWDSKQIGDALQTTRSNACKIALAAIRSFEQVLNPVKPQLHKRDASKRTKGWWDQ